VAENPRNDGESQRFHCMPVEGREPRTRRLRFRAALTRLPVVIGALRASRSSGGPTGAPFVSSLTIQIHADQERIDAKRAGPTARVDIEALEDYRIEG
jgi:hypothetical protein